NADRDVSVAGGGESRLDLTQQERVFRLFLHSLPDVTDCFLRLPLHLLTRWNSGSGHGRIDYDLVADAPDAFDFTGDLFRRVLLLLRRRLATQRDIAVQCVHIDAAGADAPVGCHSSFAHGRYHRVITLPLRTGDDRDCEYDHQERYTARKITIHNTLSWGNNNKGETAMERACKERALVNAKVSQLQIWNRSLTRTRYNPRLIMTTQ